MALPSIKIDLGFSQENLQWVISAYALFFGGFTAQVTLSEMFLPVRQRMRARADWQHIKIIMLSAKGRDAEVSKGLSMGADIYVTKPFSIRELMARVKAVLRRVSPQASALELYRFSDVEVNIRSNEVLRAGTPVELSATIMLVTVAGSTRLAAWLM